MTEKEKQLTRMLPVGYQSDIIFMEALMTSQNLYRTLLKLLLLIDSDNKQKETPDLFGMMGLESPIESLEKIGNV